MIKRTILLLVMAIELSNLGAQSKGVDSMINWTFTHPKVDSEYIVTLHRISYKGVDNNIKRSFAYYELVSYYSDSLNFTYGKALAQINLGILFRSTTNFEAGNRAYFKAIEFAEACHARRLEAVSLNNVADNYKLLKDWEKCREYAMQAVAINRDLKAMKGVAINYELLYNSDFGEKRYDSARAKLEKGMDAVGKTLPDSSLFPLYYLDFGMLKAVANEMDSATYYFDQTIQMSQSLNDPENEYAGYLAKAQYLTGLTRSQKLSLLKKAFAIATATQNLARIADAAHAMSLVYDQPSDKDSSMAWFRIYRNAADSLFSENNTRNVAIKETEWVVKKKEIENSRLKDLSAMQDKELAGKNALLLAVAICLLLSIIVAVVLFTSVKNKREIAESRLKQNIVEMQMQTLRSQMNPHFIFNSLNSIDAYIQSNDKYNATLYLNKFARLIRNVLDGSKEDVVSFSQDIETLKLYIELEEQRSDNKFSTRLDIDGELMNSDYKVPPLIIQPFVENAIIHGLRNRDGHDGLLLIRATKKGEQIAYTIQDNGIGRKAAEHLGNGKGRSYGSAISCERVMLFNKETTPSVEITDLYEDGRAVGTRVNVFLNIV